MRKPLCRIERIIVFVAVSLAVFMSAMLYQQRSNMNKYSLASKELSALRSAVASFQMLNKRLPKDLMELSAAKSDGSYLLNLPAAYENGEYIDPFGDPYNYNEDTGWVTCGSRQCANW